MNNWLKATLIVFKNILIALIVIGGLVYFTFNFPTITATVLVIIAVGMILTLIIAKVKGNLDRDDLIKRNRGK